MRSAHAPTQGWDVFIEGPAERGDVVIEAGDYPVGCPLEDCNLGSDFGGFRDDLDSGGSYGMLVMCRR